MALAGGRPERCWERSHRAPGGFRGRENLRSNVEGRAGSCCARRLVRRSSKSEVGSRGGGSGGRLQGDRKAVDRDDDPVGRPQRGRLQGTNANAARHTGEKASKRLRVRLRGRGWLGSASACRLGLGATVHRRKRRRLEMKSKVKSRRSSRIELRSTRWGEVEGRWSNSISLRVLRYLL